MTTSDRSVSDRIRAWALVLVGGQGVRRRELTRHVYGEDRPKPYAILTGGKSLLRQTLDRVRLLVPAERTVVVSMAGQGAYFAQRARDGYGWIELGERLEGSGSVPLCWVLHR